MKKILLLTCLLPLLATTGCLVAEGGHHSYPTHGYHPGHHPRAVIVGPPRVIVAPPPVILRPPTIIVR